MQEDKEPLFDTAMTVTNCLLIVNGILSTMKPVEANLKKLLVPEMLATDIAEYLGERELHECPLFLWFLWRPRSI